MRIAAASLMACLLAPSVGHATVDRLATTYHVLADPQGDGVFVVPVHFLTFHSSPETEVCGVGEADVADRRKGPGGASRNANLVRLFGLRVSVSRHDVDSTVVSIDVSRLAKPSGCDVGASEDQVIAGTVEAVSRALRASSGGQWTEGDVRVVICGDDPAKVDGWKRHERRLDLSAAEVAPLPHRGRIAAADAEGPPRRAGSRGRCVGEGE